MYICEYNFDLRVVFVYFLIKCWSKISFCIFWIKFSIINFMFFFYHYSLVVKAVLLYTWQEQFVDELSEGNFLELFFQRCFKYVTLNTSYSFASTINWEYSIFISLTDWLTDWLIDWLIDDWLIDPLIDRLIDWLYSKWLVQNILDNQWCRVFFYWDLFVV